MASILEQLRGVVEEGAKDKRDLHQVGELASQTAQLAYSLNCIWLYAQPDPPSRETLTNALPPVPDGTSDTTKESLEYIRRTLIIMRSLVSEKIEEAVRVQTDMSQFRAILGEAANRPQPQVGVEPIEAEEVEEIVREVVPMVIRPALEDKPRSPGRKARKNRPWVLT